MNAGPIVARIVSDAALDRISRNRVELVAVVESLHRRGVGIASLAPSESWLQPLGAHPTEVERMMCEIILRVMAWAAQAELDSIKRRIEAGVRRAAEEGRFPGRPRALTPDQIAAIRLLRRNGQSEWCCQIPVISNHPGHGPGTAAHCLKTATTTRKGPSP